MKIVKGELRYNGGEVMKQVLVLLKALRIPAERQNTAGFAAVHNGKRRFIQCGQKGQGDIRGVLPGGRALEIEAKAWGEYPTFEQGRRILKLNREGAIAFWVDRVETADWILRVVLGRIARGQPVHISYIERGRCVIGDAPDPRELREWPKPKKKPKPTQETRP